MRRQDAGNEPLGPTSERDGALPAPSADARGPVFYQVSTLNALMMGNFDGAVSVGELLAHGSWGIGTYEGLDGEAVICEGRAYDAHADGTVVEYGADERVAFSTVASFTPRAGGFSMDPCPDLAAVRRELERIRRAYDPNDNAWFLMAMRGSFPFVRVRSCEKQRQKPYPTLPEVARCQREHAYEHERGWIIGVWTPAYLEGINLPGWHVHYLSNDRRRGGHVLELSVDRAEGRIEGYTRFQLDLPENEEFKRLDLGRDLSRETAGVEG